MKIDVTLENARAILLKKSPMFTKDRDRRSPFEATILEVSPSGKYVRLQDSPPKRYSDGRMREREPMYKDDIEIRNASWIPVNVFSDVEVLGSPDTPKEE